MQLQYEKAQRLWEKGKISKAELDALKPSPAPPEAPPAPDRGASHLTVTTDRPNGGIEEAVMKVLKGKGFSEVMGVEKTLGMASVRLSAEAMAKVAELRQAQAEIDKRKGELSNSLGDFPKNVPVPEICDKILQLRGEWGAISKRIKVVEMGGSVAPSPLAPNGGINSDEGAEGGIDEPQSNLALHEAIIASLPTDRYELKTKERNLVALLSKDRGKLRAAKDPAKKQELTVKIQQNELVLQAMREKLKC